MKEQNNDKKIGILLGLIVVVIIFSWVSVTLYSLVQDSQAVYIHNPHESEMKLEIDGKRYCLSPNKTKKIDLSEGTYHVKSFLNGAVLMDTSIVLSSTFLDNGGLINLSGEPLYLWTETYGSSGIEQIYVSDNSLSSGKSPLSQLQSQGLGFLRIDSTLLVGNIKEYGRLELVLVKEWRFGIDEAFEDKIQATDQSNVVLGEKVSKIFNKKEILLYWEKNYGGLTRFDKITD